jgi:hypothetical protein
MAMNDFSETRESVSGLGDLTSSFLLAKGAFRFLENSSEKKLWSMRVKSSRLKLHRAWLDLTLTRATGKSANPGRRREVTRTVPHLPFFPFPMMRIEFDQAVLYVLRQKSAARKGSMSKPGSVLRTEAMVARCITLDVQGGESRSSGKTMTSWRFKGSKATSTRATVEHTVIESHRSPRPVPSARHCSG